MHWEFSYNEHNLNSQTDVEANKIVPGKKLPIWKKRETQVNTELNELDIKHEVLTPKAYGKAAAQGK